MNSGVDIDRMNGVVASEEEDEETEHGVRDKEGSETDGDSDDPTNGQETRELASPTDELTGVRIRSPRLFRLPILKIQCIPPSPSSVAASGSVTLAHGGVLPFILLLRSSRPHPFRARYVATPPATLRFADDDGSQRCVTGAT